MIAFEFLTRLNDNESLSIPQEYLQKLRNGVPVRVILLIEENGKGS